MAPEPAQTGLTRPASRHPWEAFVSTSMTVPPRFWSKLRLGPIPAHRPELGPCWIWMAGLDRDGYGQFGMGSRTWAAHVYLYTVLVGAVSAGLELDHLCRARACVNPAHLEPITHRENILRGESPVARAARATACPRGHPYDETNTYIELTKSEGSKRRCRLCLGEDRRSYRQRNKALVSARRRAYRQRNKDAIAAYHRSYLKRDVVKARRKELVAR